MIEELLQPLTKISQWTVSPYSFMLPVGIGEWTDTTAEQSPIERDEVRGAKNIQPNNSKYVIIWNPAVYMS
jgi:hypothetical protein